MAYTLAEWNALKEKNNEPVSRKPKSNKPKPIQHESKLQTACVNYFRLLYPDLLLFAVPNGGSRNPKEGSRLKQEGVLAGVSDLILLHPNKDYHALCIEMKVGTNKQQPSQIEFEAKATQAGYKYIVVKSFDEFQNKIKEYLKDIV